MPCLYGRRRPRARRGRPNTTASGTSTEACAATTQTAGRFMSGPNLMYVVLFFLAGLLVMVFPAMRRFWKTGKFMKMAGGEQLIEIEMQTNSSG